MSEIPKIIHTVLADRIMHACEGAGIGIFYLPIEMEFENSIDIDRLVKAADLLMDTHPVLGCRFIVNRKQPYWERFDNKSRSVVKIASSAAEYTEWLTERIDVEKSPPFAIYILRQGVGDRMCLKVQHQAADSGGSLEICYKLASIYRKLKTEPDWKPIPNLLASRGYDQLIRRIPWYAWPKIVWNFFKYHVRTVIPFMSHSIQVTGKPPFKPSFEVLHFKPERVLRISEHGRAQGATLNDMLITAMIRAQAAVKKKEDRAAYRLLTTIDFRKWYLPEKRAEDFCNLSGYVYINLGKKLGDSFDQTLSVISADTRCQKEDFYGLHDAIILLFANSLAYNHLKKVLASLAAFLSTNTNMMNILTNLGPINEDELLFDENPLRAWVLPPAVFPPILGVGFSGYGGGLTLATSIYDCDHEIVKELFKKIEAELSV